MKTETLSIGGLERAVRVYDWCRDREASVIAEEIDLRLRYGRGGRDGPADSVSDEMLLFRRSDRWRDPTRLTARSAKRGWRVQGGIPDALIVSLIRSGIAAARPMAKRIGCSIGSMHLKLRRMADRGTIRRGTKTVRVLRLGRVSQTWEVVE